jgi:tRNA 2-selenouridine synthase
MSSISIEELLSGNYKIIDVRSENEYEQSHIPGAINIPILDNEQRENVGKMYKYQGREDAIELGIDLVKDKLNDYYSSFNKLSKDSSIAIYCARGGMRSNSIYSFLTGFGLKNVFIVEGGYKQYRNYIIDNLKTQYEKRKFLVLHGNTGSGKTILLGKLSKLGISIIDLEYLAKNAGSVFGTIPFEEKMPTQKQFENLLFHELFNSKEHVIIESEGKRIGNINLDNSFHEYLMNSTHILLETTIENRVDNIYSEYLYSFKNEKLIEALEKLRKWLSNTLVEELINKIKEDDYKYVIRNLIIEYYDPIYKFSIDKFAPYYDIVTYSNIEDGTIKIRKIFERLYEEK